MTRGGINDHRIQFFRVNYAFKPLANTLFSQDSFNIMAIGINMHVNFNSLSFESSALTSDFFRLHLVVSRCCE